MFGIWLLGYYDKLPVRLVFWLACLTIGFAMVWAVANPMYYQRSGGMPRFAPFHGGAGNVVGSALIILVCVLIVHQTMLAGFARPRLAWLFIGLGSIMIVGYWSTATQLTTITYFLVHYLYSSRLKVGTKALIVLLAGATFVAIIVEKEQRNMKLMRQNEVRIESIGTGRFGAWIERAELISRRDITIFLVGGGSRSEVVKTKTWGDKEKNSHNIFLTYFIDTGLIGVIAFIAFFVMIIRRLGPPSYAIFAALFVSSFLGNGLPVRPMPFVLFWIAVALVALQVGEPARSPRPKRSRGPTEGAGAPGNATARVQARDARIASWSHRNHAR